MPEINGQTLGTGCYVDGHWGQYSASRVLGIADAILGTNYTAEATAAMIEDHNSDDPYSSPLPTDGCMTDELPGCEIASEAADEAESALNDATPDGYLWHWYDGEFFLSPDCGRDGYGPDADDCDDETCYCHCY